MFSQAEKPRQPEHLRNGSAAETIAAKYLASKNLRLLERNFRCPYGEIDLIMQDAGSLVFVEVRMRSSGNFGGAAMSITPSKQEKLKRTAQHYMQLHGEQRCRFDVVLMHAVDPNAIEWLKDAF